jgi:hypothetical protein
VPWLFANVQKLLQIGVFFLLSHRVCSPLFVWVGVNVGVRNRSDSAEICILSAL